MGQRDGRRRFAHVSAVAVAVVLAASVVLVTATAEAAPVIAASPDTALVDGQLIAVTATGLDNIRHSLGECTGSTVGTCEFVYSQPGNSADFTSITVTIRARAAVLPVFGGAAVNCQTAACTLAIIPTVPNSSSDPIGVSTPLGFAMGAPIQPIPHLTVSPNVNVNLGASLHVTGPAYFNPNEDVRITFCDRGGSGPATQLSCSLVSQGTTADATGAVDANVVYDFNPDVTIFPIATDGSCVVANGCRYVAAIEGSGLSRAMLGAINSGDPNATTTTSRATTTVAPVAAQPTFTG
jgi:hypothetical protein